MDFHLYSAGSFVRSFATMREARQAAFGLPSTVISPPSGLRPALDSHHRNLNMNTTFTSPDLSAEYLAALDAHNTALAAYRSAVTAFRAGGSTEEFLRAKAARQTADAAFDSAFATEAEKGEGA